MLDQDCCHLLSLRNVRHSLRVLSGLWEESGHPRALFGTLEAVRASQSVGTFTIKFRRGSPCFSRMGTPDRVQAGGSQYLHKPYRVRRHGAIKRAPWGAENVGTIFDPNQKRGLRNPARNQIPHHGCLTRNATSHFAPVG